MSTIRYFQHRIVQILTGETPELRGIPKERLDWGGPGALLAEYAAGDERTIFIQAIGMLILEGKHQKILAELIAFASAIDIAQVAPHVLYLRNRGIIRLTIVREAADQFLAMRFFRSLSLQQLQQLRSP